MSPIQSSRATHIAQLFATDFPGSAAISKEIVARMVQLTHLFEQENAPLFESYGLNRAMFSALVALRLSHVPYELRHNELQQRILLTSGGLTNLCKRLESAGLIARRPDPDDRRGVIFALSDSGLTVANELIPMQHTLEKKLLEVLTDEENETLRNLLEKISNRYDSL